ncbi:MAG: hypothetical protein J5830_06225 [Clostridia bacterium]|nr:hypothetical protein [Clostridia bacterium]
MRYDDTTTAFIEEETTDTSVTGFEDTEDVITDSQTDFASSEAVISDETEIEDPGTVSTVSETLPDTAEPETETDVPATEPGIDDTTENVGDVTDPVQEDDGPSLPDKRTLYGTDPRSHEDLFEHGVGDVDVNRDYCLGRGFAVNGKMSPDGHFTCTAANWDQIDDYANHWTNDGENTYSLFLTYSMPITVNEIVFGDVTFWVGADFELFTDISRLEIWYASDPDGIWTRWENTIANSFENIDAGILWGTYAQGISITGPDVTASCFLIYDPAPNEKELWLISNIAGPVAIYNVS